MHLSPVETVAGETCVSQGNVAAQPAVYGRVVSEYRSAQSNQLQHALRSQDPDDDLSGHRATRRDVVSVDRRQLVPASLREVATFPRYHCSFDSLYFIDVRQQEKK